MIDIKNRYNDQVLFTSEIAADMREAVEEAVRWVAPLWYADLAGAGLAGTDLYAADLAGAGLAGTDLYAADLAGADLRGANLYGADLRKADLRVAYLAGANLRGADLAGADLRGAYLAGADGITFDAGPSGQGHLIPLDADGKHDRDGEWHISIGCWQDKTLDDLRALIDDEAEWPEATGGERERRRPYLRAVLALCEAHIAYQEGAAL